MSNSVLGINRYIPGYVYIDPMIEKPASDFQLFSYRPASQTIVSSLDKTSCVSKELSEFGFYVIKLMPCQRTVPSRQKWNLIFI